jgi:hypothetical protein
VATNEALSLSQNRASTGLRCEEGFSGGFCKRPEIRVGKRDNYLATRGNTVTTTRLIKNEKPLSPQSAV